nr:hypothetical protein [Tanacetum cinerariifolium]
MPKIEKYVTETLGAEVLIRSTNQPQTAYAVTNSLSKFKLKKILIDKMKANKSINRSDTQKNLYNVLIESYNSKKDIITSYGDVVLLKIGRDDQNKDEDPSAGSGRGRKRRKYGKDVEPSKDSRHAARSKFVTRDNDEQPVDNEVTKADWFKKPKRPLTPDLDWSKRRQIDFRQPQTWITQAELADEHPTSFDEFNDTSFDFSAFSIMELEYHFEERSKATTKRLDWHNPENKPYPFDLKKPLSLIQDHRGRQIILKDYFINKDLKYLKGGDSSRRYSTCGTKTKASRIMESRDAGTDNCPPMLEESNFDSWEIRIQRYIHRKPNGKLIWNSIKNGPTSHPTTIDTTGEEAENIKELADIQAINILSQGLPRHILNTMNQTETAQEIWENVELLM